MCIRDSVSAALYAPTAGIVCPFGLNLALAENAYENGVEFRFDTEVKMIQKTEAGYTLETVSYTHLDVYKRQSLY